jgi:hypothetical protein
MNDIDFCMSYFLLYPEQIPKYLRLLIRFWGIEGIYVENLG